MSAAIEVRGVEEAFSARTPGQRSTNRRRLA